MNIKKRLLIPLISEDGAVFLTRTTYTAPQGVGLLQFYCDLISSDTFDTYFLRRSADNGATWSEPTSIFHPKRLPEGMLRQGEPALLLDGSRHRIFRFYNHSIYPGLDEYTTGTMKLMRIDYEISHDGGLTFSKPQQLIVQGGDAVHWAPRTVYGRNSVAISFCRPIVDRRGRIILSARWVPEVANTTPKTAISMQTVCLIGETGAGGDLTWRAGDFVSIDPDKLSVRGLGEPAIIELTDGRILMICRGSNVWRPEMPGRKWMTTSADGGLTWAPVAPWGYDTGELFYSPATGSNILRSSRNGKIYWIGNIVPENPQGNQPRFPLCIAEVDEETLTLRKDSVRVIDTRRPEDSPRVQLSNFHTYEDRLTGEFVVILSRIFESSETLLRSPAYEYRVPVPW